jgi:hypothetical protein
MGLEEMAGDGNGHGFMGLALANLNFIPKIKQLKNKDGLGSTLDL